MVIVLKLKDDHWQYLQNWKRKAKRLATHGVSKKNADALTYVGSKGMVALRKKHPGEETAGSSSQTSATTKSYLQSRTDLNPVYKVTMVTIILLDLLTWSLTSDFMVSLQITQTEPVDIAAHFALLSDSLTNIGTALSVNVSKTNIIPISATL